MLVKVMLRVIANIIFCKKYHLESWKKTKYFEQNLFIGFNTIEFSFSVAKRKTYFITLEDEACWFWLG